MHQLTRLLAMIVLGATMLSGAGCGSTSPITKTGRATSLEASFESYRKLIRWGYYDEAVKYVRTRDGAAARADLSLAARYRVTSFEMRSQLMADTGKEARVLAIIEYYEIDRGVIDTVNDEQLWWFDDEDKHWYLASGLPPFGLAQDKRAPSPIPH